jgi:serine/threonine protein phosphatase 1
LPDGLRAYAVGDIHGRFDLLERLYGQIRRDLQEEPPTRSVEIFLGDYLDRGEQSCQVVEWMISAEPACDDRICLLGNHEDMLLQALADPSAMQHWLRNGGLETVLSYKPIPRHIMAGMTLSKAHAEFRAAMPDTHLGFLRGLRRSAELGDYLFVHAGLRPGRTVEGQDPEDLIWIREPFHSSSFDFGRIVVHGHTPVVAPEVRPNRINIDTGAVFTGRLTCLVLEGETRRFLHTGSA